MLFLLVVVAALAAMTIQPALAWGEDGPSTPQNLPGAPPPSSYPPIGQQGTNGKVVNHYDVRVTRVYPTTYVRIAPTEGEVRNLRDRLLRKEVDSLTTSSSDPLRIYCEAAVNLRFGYFTLPGGTVHIPPDGRGTWASHPVLVFHLNAVAFNEANWRQVSARANEARAREIRKLRKGLDRTTQTANRGLILGQDNRMKIGHLWDSLSQAWLNVTGIWVVLIIVIFLLVIAFLTDALRDREECLDTPFCI